MTLDEYLDGAMALRQEYPERPSEQQWDEFFVRLAELGPMQGGIGELWTLERARHRLEAEQHATTPTS